MKNSCVYRPNKGQKLFDNLNKNFGYQTAKDIYLLAGNKKFQFKYGKSLIIDDEGFPTYDSLIKNKFIRNRLKSASNLKSLNNKSTIVEDNFDNYTALVQEAYDFNSNNELNDSIVAIVNKHKEGIRIEYIPNTDTSVQQFKEQYATILLNNSVINILSSIGITIDKLKEKGLINGQYGGMLNLNNAKEFCEGIDSLITVANNSEGVKSVGEEFSHLIIRIFKDEVFVQRALKYLSNEKMLKSYLGETEYNNLLLEYKNTETPIELVAEEVLGRMLKQALLKTAIQQVINNPTNILERAFKTVINKFKNLYSNIGKNSINNIEKSLEELSHKILTNKLNIAKEDVIQTKSNVIFHATAESAKNLNTQVDKTRKILEKILEKETKSAAIQHVPDSTFIVDSAPLIDAINSNDLDKMHETILKFSLGVIKELNVILKKLSSIEDLSKELSNTDDPIKLQIKSAEILAVVRRHLYSYKDLIMDLQDLLDTDSQFKDFIENNNSIAPKYKSTRGIVNSLSSLQIGLESIYKKAATSVFVDSLMPVVEGQFTEEEVRNMVLKADKDVSFLDKWTESMFTSKDVLLQLIAKKVSKVQYTIKQKVVNDSKVIKQLMTKANDLGLTDFSFIYERDEDGIPTGYLLDKYDYSRRNRELKEYKEKVASQYENPFVRAAAVKKAVSDWKVAHPLSEYENSAYTNLSDVQKEFLNDYRQIKNILDTHFSNPRMLKNRAVQLPKGHNQRIIDSLKSNNFNYIIQQSKQAFKEGISIQLEDEENFGTVQQISLDLSGNEYLTVPQLYTSLLPDSSKLSTDAIGALINYSYAAHLYQEMSTISNVMEIGKDVMSYREVVETSGSATTVDIVRKAGITVANEKKKSSPRSLEKYIDYVDSQVFLKQDKPSISTLKYWKKINGSWEEKSIALSKTKIVNELLSFASKVQQGTNFLSQGANVMIGKAMIRIESMAGQFFDYSTLLHADKIYTTELLPSYLAELGVRNKHNKLSLLGEMIDLNKDFDNLRGKDYRKNVLWRFYGPHWLYLGQSAGDHYLYYRVLIAYALHKKVLIPDGQGNYIEGSLWDAIDYKKVNDDSEYEDLAYIIPGTKDANTDKLIDVFNISQEIKQINHKLFGVYNKEDMMMARRFILGKLLTQYKSWMKTAFNYRFQTKQYNVVTGKEEEGYYITLCKITYNLLREFTRGKVQLAAFKETLSEDDKANLKRAITEIVQYYSFMLSKLVLGLGDGSDKRRHKFLEKLLYYYSIRITRDLAAMTPFSFLSFLEENFKMIRTPFPSWQPVEDLFKFGSALVDPESYITVMESGPYKGYTEFEKYLLKAPIPIINQYKHIDRFLDPTDAVMYYLKSY